MNDWQSWAALGIVGLTLIILLLRARRKRKKGGGCDSGCGKCD